MSSRRPTPSSWRPHVASSCNGPWAWSCPEEVGVRSARTHRAAFGGEFFTSRQACSVASSGRGISSVTEGTPSAARRTGNEGFVPQRHKPHTGWARGGHCRAPARKRGFGSGEDSVVLAAFQAGNPSTCLSHAPSVGTRGLQRSRLWRVLHTAPQLHKSRRNGQACECCKERAVRTLVQGGAFLDGKVSGGGQVLLFFPAPDTHPAPHGHSLHRMLYRHCDIPSTGILAAHTWADVKCQGGDAPRSNLRAMTGDSRETHTPARCPPARPF